jgi:hypothetical protein
MPYCGILQSGIGDLSRGEFEIDAMNFYPCWCAFLVLIAIPEFGRAHSLDVIVRVVNRTVVVEARFDSDDAADDCTITVIAPNGREIANGVTDRNGIFTFSQPEPGQYRIVADAGAGHRAVKSLTVNAVERVRDDTPARGLPNWVLILIGLLLIAGGTVIWMQVARFRPRVNSA